jgi:putative phosphoribosyl transferase
MEAPEMSIFASRSEPLFEDRRDAGRQLASALARYQQSRAVVLALPRGGVPVAFEVGRALDAPLDVFLVRKLGLPGQEELAMGALATGVRVLNEEAVTGLRIPEPVIDAVTQREAGTVTFRGHEDGYRISADGFHHGFVRGEKWPGGTAR